MEPIVKKWYDFLEEGKIMGMKCKDCQSMNFPPISACRKCRSRNLKWEELSGDGMLLMYSVSGALPGEKFASQTPFAYGQVILKEKALFATKIEGVPVSTPQEIEKGNENLPAPVKAKIVNGVGGMKVVVFEKV